MTKSAHSLGDVWSIPTIVITSPFISDAESSNRTRTLLAGDTEGSVARLARAVASTATLKSPAAMVGFDLKEPGALQSSRAILILKSSFLVGGL